MRYLQAPQRPTAVFAMNDMMAMQAIKAAGLAGLRVPEDLSLVGFDDDPAIAFPAKGGGSGRNIAGGLRCVGVEHGKALLLQEPAHEGENALLLGGEGYRGHGPWIQ